MTKQQQSTGPSPDLWPFAILALPRSRTTWLSKWLSYARRTVGHDLAADGGTIQGFLDKLWPLAGTVETSGGLAAPVLRQAAPGIKLVTIRRPLAEVQSSLIRQGVTWMGPDLEAKDKILDAVETLGAERIEFKDLEDVNCCAWLFEHLLGVPFDFNWWQLWSKQVVLTDTSWALERARANQVAIEKLKAELAAGVPTRLVRIGWERLGSAQKEIQILSQVHFSEAYAGGLKRRFDPDWQELFKAEAGGGLVLVTARVNGELVGYLIWTLVKEIETSGMLSADQGPWFVAPGCALGPKLLNWSLDQFRRAGIGQAQLHAPVHGRGAKLSRLFSRLGAVEIQSRWALDLGAKNG